MPELETEQASDGVGIGEPSPAGLVPSQPRLDGVTEIRLHGVGGATPGSLLGEHPIQRVSGDTIAGFYRRPDAGGRHIEAYSWGGLTSRSSARVLWLLLLPFLLANLAGWMLPPRLLQRPRMFALYRIATRWAALAVTLNAVLYLTWIPIDYVGYQCGGLEKCYRRWSLTVFDAVVNHPGKRILLAALVPLLGIAVMLLLSRITLNRYESVTPPTTTGTPHREPARSAASLTGGLSHPDFWRGRRATARLATCHLAAAVAVLAALVAHTARSAVDAGSPPAVWIALALSGLVVAGVAVALVTETDRPWPGRLADTMLVTAVAALVVAAVFAWNQPAAPYREQELPGMGQAVTITVVTVGATLALLLATVLAGTTIRARGCLLMLSIAGAILLALHLVPLANFPAARLVGTAALAAGLIAAGSAARRAYDRFRWAAPFVVMSLAVGVLNCFMLGVLVQVADAVGDIRYLAMNRPETDEPVITVLINRVLAPYLVVMTAAVTLVFLVWQGVLVWRATRGPDRERIRQTYLAWERDHRPCFPERWTASTVSDAVLRDPSAPDPLRVRRWAGTVAAWRRVGQAPLDLDLLFTGIVVAAVFLFSSLRIRDESINGGPSWVISLGATVAASLPLVLILLLRTGWADPERRKVIGVLWDVGTFWPRSYHPFAPPSYAERAVPELQRRIWWLHDNGGRVVLTAHSQGSVLAVAALAQPPQRSSGDRVALVTYGSPVRKLYNWGFPAYFNEDLLRRLRVERWENLHYPTDFIGGPAVAEPVCRDVELLDPPTSRFRYGEPVPRVGSHTGYQSDPALWKAVDQAAALLTTERRQDGDPSHLRS
ncbi:hypothetical protein [Nonomuraea maritima]|uniref:hypothetical protein n=1 Tax=Nonomuraea maritima TaxID=683260 RepID=UPI003721BFF1